MTSVTGAIAHTISPELPALKPMDKCAAVCSLSGPGNATWSAAPVIPAILRTLRCLVWHHGPEAKLLGLPPAYISEKVREGDGAASKSSSLAVESETLWKASLLVFDSMRGYNTTLCCLWPFPTPAASSKTCALLYLGRVMVFGQTSWACSMCDFFSH